MFYRVIFQKGLAGGTWFSESHKMNTIGNTVTLQWFYYQLEEIILKECENMVVKSHNLKHKKDATRIVDNFAKLQMADIEAVWNEDLLWKYMIKNKSGRKVAGKSLIKILQQAIDTLAESPKMEDLWNALFYGIADSKRYCFDHARNEYLQQLQAINEQKQAEIDTFNANNKDMIKSSKLFNLKNIDEKYITIEKKLAQSYAISSVNVNEFHLDTRCDFMNIVKSYVGDDQIFDLWRLFCSTQWFNHNSPSSDVAKCLLPINALKRDTAKWGRKALREFKKTWKDPKVTDLPVTNQNREFNNQIV